MRPQSHAPLVGAGRTAVSAWSRRMLAICAVTAAAMMTHSALYQHSDINVQNTRTEQPALTASCMQWHQAASEAVARLAQSTIDSDLRQAHDAIFRMRRARRNCEEGWVGLACQDYYAVTRNLTGYASTHDEPFFACRRSAGHVDGGAESIR
jgi:hypothetical protein